MGLYRKTYLCVCEGQQEIMYLKHLASLLKQMPQRIVTFNTTEGNARKLIKNYTEYDNACPKFFINFSLSFLVFSIIFGA